MKIHEKIDLYQEDGIYEKYEPEYYDYLWSCIEPVLKELLETCNSKDYTSKRAAEYYLASLFEQNPEFKNFGYRFIGGNTPIEKLYYECFSYICWKEKIKLYLLPQFGIEVEGKKYFVDFLICTEYIDSSKNNKYVVECDGYDYHSSKKQQAYDNQRQRDIENAGYTVIRFSGKEIFDDEVKCVYETLKRLDIEVKQ